MTFAEIYTEAVNLRFNNSATKLAQVKKWVNAAEISLWNGRKWAFRRPPAVNVTVSVVGGIGVATAPADFGKARRLADPFGDRLEYLDPDTFEELYVFGSPAVPGPAAAYTVIDRQIQIGPAASGTYKLAYQRRYTKRNSGGTATQGVMSADLDTPDWDSEHHYILVPLAIRVGEIFEADPTYPSLEALLSDGGPELLSLFQAMEEELLVGVDGELEVWGSPYSSR